MCVCLVGLVLVCFDCVFVCDVCCGVWCCVLFCFVSFRFDVVWCVFYGVVVVSGEFVAVCCCDVVGAKCGLCLCCVVVVRAIFAYCVLCCVGVVLCIYVVVLC